jgi:tetratricopeptide (TPR) repeat protein
MMTRKLYAYQIILIIVITVVVSQLAFAQARLKDVITTRDNKTKEGEIVKEDFKFVQITLQGGGGSESVPLANIDNIRYDIQVAEWFNAETAWQQKNYKKAVELYEVLLAKVGQLRVIFKPHIIYKLAVSYQALNQWDKAISLYDTLAKEIPDNRFCREASDAEVKCHLAKGDRPGAVKATEKYKSIFNQIKASDELSYGMELLKGDILFVIDPKQARQVYTSLIRDASAYPEIRDSARVGLGRCQLSEKQYSDAERNFNEVIKESLAPAVLRGAYTGLGDCYRVVAEKSNTLVDYKKALRAYLRVNVLYLPQEGESIDEYCRASYYAASCLNIMANFIPDADKQKQHKEYAKRIAIELRSSPAFASNKWVKDLEQFVK